jgi:dipeptidase E
MRLLLISNSTTAGEEYLGWPSPYIKSFLENTNVKKVLFVPYAGMGLSEERFATAYDIYEEKVKKVYQSLGYEIESIHRGCKQC